MERRRIGIIVSGRVQGVGFRFFTRNCARKYNISGWVRNCDDGSVEIEAEGEKDKIENFTEEIKKGPPSSRVTDVKICELPLNNEKEEGFHIRF
ncbi:MAG: acylphosphatase [Chitinispirillaceae bacterium]|nr:acylphosphatase [Chitinispirillaceae bacterium]